MQKSVMLTEEGLRKLEEELEFLKGEKRKEIAEKIKVARSFGDLSENSEYDEAKNEQAILEARIATIEADLKNAVIIDESDRLTALVNSLLEISKIESGNIELEISEFSIHEKMDNIMQRYRVLVERDGYDITFVPDDDVICRGDSAKIDQVIYNLINNAVNYCGEGKKIVIRQINKPGAVRIEVTDDGQGIAKDKLPKIFDRYYRDERNKRDKIGTGLGLSIVQGILKKHQLPFGVVSEEGKGSTFWFEFIVENEKDKQKEKPSKKQGKKPV